MTMRNGLRALLNGWRHERPGRSSARTSNSIRPFATVELFDVFPRDPSRDRGSLLIFGAL